MAPKPRRRARGRGLAEAHGFARNCGSGTGPAHELEIRAGPRRRRRPARPAGMRATTRAPRKSSVSMAVALFATLMASATSSAAPGSLDATFGTGGKVTTSFSGSADMNALVVQPDGKLVAAGVVFNGVRWDFALARYNTDGSLDTTFGTGGKIVTAIGTDGTGASALVLQPDGKLVAAGATTSDGSTYDFTVVRYNTHGSLDPTFGTGGKVTTAVGTGDDVAFALALQPDGNLVAGGYAANAGTDAFALVRYLGQVCGDAVVASPEQCDAGTANGTASSCCTATCQFATAATTCTGGLCDSTGHCVLTTTTTTTSTTTTTTTTSTTTTTASPTTTSTTTSTTSTTSTTTAVTTTTTASPTTTTTTTSTTTSSAPTTTTTTSTTSTTS